MRRYAEITRLGETTRGTRRALLEARRDRVRARMAQLEDDLEVLNYKIAMYGADGKDES